MPKYMIFQVYDKSAIKLDTSQQVYYAKIIAGFGGQFKRMLGWRRAGREEPVEKRRLPTPPILWSIHFP